MRQDIPGTVIFDGDQAQKGYALNRMCFSFNSAGNRAEFLENEEAYCNKFGLSEEQRAAVKGRDVLRMIEAGGNVYYLAKLAGIFGLNVQDIGAQQTHTTVDEFKAETRCGREMTMARIIGGIATTHVPSIGKAIAENRQNDPYWQPFFKGFDFVHGWLAREKPDVAVVFYNDHGLNFFLDKLPTFAVGAAQTYRNEDEGWGIPVSRSIAGDPELSWHLINALVADEFDITMCQEMLVDHAVTIPMTLMWPGQKWEGIKIVPISINTVQHPLPSMARCLQLGRSIGRAIENYGKDLLVLIVGTGGLSHQLDGTRAGFISKEFDQLCLNTIVDDPDSLAKYSIHELVAEAGAQGVEFLNWMAMRGALPGYVIEAHRNYHIPISNTAGATVVLENRPEPARKAA